MLFKHIAFVMALAGIVSLGYHTPTGVFLVVAAGVIYIMSRGVDSNGRP